VIQINKLIFVLLLMVYSLLAIADNNMGLQVLNYNINFTPNAPTHDLILENNSNELKYVQIKPLKWDIVNAKDVYTKTEDILAVPPLIQIKPKQNQIVRLVAHKPFGEKELTYKVIVDDLTPFMHKTSVQQDPDSAKVAVKIHLIFMFPAYISPKTIAKPNVAWTLKRQTNGTLTLTAKNLGNTHIKLSELSLINPANDKAYFNSTDTYVLLANDSQSFAVKAPLTSLAQAKITGFIDSSKIDAIVAAK
jgi:fimbrial chaperone protein